MIEDKAIEIATTIKSKNHKILFELLFVTMIPILENALLDAIRRSCSSGIIVVAMNWIAPLERCL